MYPFIIYIIKSIVVAGICYGYYQLMLRNKKMHSFNRFYILASMMVSLIVPFIHLEWTTNVAVTTPAVIQLLNVVSATGAEREPIIATTYHFALSDVLWAAYFATALVMVYLMITKIVYLKRLRRNSVLMRGDGICIIETEEQAAPFSFLNTIFWKNGIDINSEAGKSILRHELAHIRQYHTVDKLCIQILLAFFWMNPFYWLFNKELSMVHEFLADEDCIDGNNTSAFAEMLLRSHFGNKFPGIIQPFFHSPIKRRLAMLHKTTPTRYAAMRRLLVVPVLAATVFLLSFSVKEKTMQKATEKTVIIVDAGHGGPDAGGSNAAGIKEKDLTLRISKVIARIAPEYNIEVIQTREENYPTLATRAKAAVGTTASMFISVHVNKYISNDPTHNGYELTVCKNNPRYNNSRLLASAIMGKFTTENPSLKEKNLVVLKDNTVPAVLIECGNIEDAKNLAVLQNDQQLEQMCRKILAGVVLYKNSAVK
ncbi:hypothetical protein CJD36_015395 [Flavipsychrobacter stenotrophus]|uniref:N-acetylmuramoyl-L-alanine amidase n=1 Tax=Flavipsychrobacter stenotrophus TaxID=2077091 RepID=A0A2S7STY7_9BACT|nr:M56/M15 family metallopeptidase [Flavipsychrobacter stenotrophus]PQJ10081.1 hypothetical protein CJD36_015395 [Flavipsychrobacter stenotrophus]